MDQQLCVLPAGEAGRVLDRLLLLEQVGRATVAWTPEGGLGRPDMAGLAGSAAERAERTMIEERDIIVAMRDGTRLAVDVYRPDAPGRYPVLYASALHNKDSSEVTTASQPIAEKAFSTERRFPTP